MLILDFDAQSRNPIRKIAHAHRIRSKRVNEILLPTRHSKGLRLFERRARASRDQSDVK
jgi:hypothetical protein